MAKHVVEPFLSAHEREDDWPITRGVDERGRGVLVCRGCGDELPDGVAVERAAKGKVRAVTYEAPAPVDEWPDGEPPPPKVAETHHVCGGRNG